MMATATHLLTPEEAAADVPLESVVVRFAGDSGDGMQLTGGQFTLSTALAGNDLATFPDFPAEIRAPQGTTFGVSAFQINFGSAAIETAGGVDVERRGAADEGEGAGDRARLARRAERQQQRADVERIAEYPIPDVGADRRAAEQGDAGKELPRAPCL